MTEFKRDYGFGDLPHIFDENWKDGEFWDNMGYVKELCPVCKAHLRQNGICLNACHLGESSKKRFIEMMIKAQDEVDCRGK
jgi:hypothetical protein